MTPELSKIRVHPVKSLDPMDLEEVPVENGGIKYDREYAMFDENDRYVNGRNNDRVHLLRSEFNPDKEELTLRIRGEDRKHRFDLTSEIPELETWLSDFFEKPVTVRESSDARFTDQAGGLSPKKLSAPGPSIVGAETYREIASWFDQYDVDEIRRRFRTNLEIEGVPPFWEDNLFSDKRHVVEFRIGDVLMRGILPIPRCVVPTRDPATGEHSPEFRDVFTDNRREMFPEWANEDQLGQHVAVEADHYFYLTVATRIPRSEDGKTVAIGDEVEIVGEEALLKVL